MVSGPTRGPILGSVPLTSFLSDQKDLPDLDEETVIPYIKDKLNYRVQDFEGRAQDANILPSLKFAVVGQNMTHRGMDRLPTLGAVVVYTEATKGLATHGLQEGEEMPG